MRAQYKQILLDLEKKMVLLVGPRQSGKTTLAKAIAALYPKSIYLNYDAFPDRTIIENQSWLKDCNLLVLDELHKMPNWKNYLKGVYDTKPEGLALLVTGSARLEHFDKIGDSLAGRYFKHRLLPLSLSELHSMGRASTLEFLLERGGFPEPYFADSDLDAKRWRMQYMESLLSTDIFEIETIHNLKSMRTVLSLLRQRVGSSVSYQSLSEDVGTSPITVKKYIDILEAVYVIFRVTPYSRNIARSLLKEPKIYFYDTGMVDGGPGPKLENLVAVSLLKSIQGRQDQLAEPLELHYLRTKEGVEVDFAIATDDGIESIIEVKVGDQTISKSLRDYHKKYQFPAVQIVQGLEKEYREGEIEVRSAARYLQELFL